jgi:hypothetical protein
MILGCFKIDRQGIFIKAPPERGWKWDLILDFKRSERKPKVEGFKSFSFKSFFDTSTGKEVWNMEQIKEQERAGKLFLRHDEAERIANKNKQEIERKDRERFREELRPKAREILRKYRHESSRA